MKNNILIAIGCLSLLFSCQLSAQAQTKCLGLISELTQLKCESEWRLAQSVNHPDSFQSTLQQYITVYTLVNSMLSQMEADMIAANSLREYKQLDKLLKQNSIESCKADNELIEKYIEIMQTAMAVWRSKTTKAFLPLTYLSSVVDIAETTVGVINTIHDMQKAKVKSICQCLDGTRLSNYSDIVKLAVAKK